GTWNRSLHWPATDPAGACWRHRLSHRLPAANPPAFANRHPDAPWTASNWHPVGAAKWTRLVAGLHPTVAGVADKSPGSRRSTPIPARHRQVLAGDAATIRFAAAFSSTSGGPCRDPSPAPRAPAGAIPRQSAWARAAVVSLPV